MAEKEYSELKKRALLAKQRLRMGYWQRMEEERRQTLEEIGDDHENVQLVHTLQQEKVRRDERMVMQADKASEEELFYMRVCTILDSGDTVSNPIGQLIDEKEYAQLDESNRQRYILQLAAKFREMQERYRRERAGKSG